MTCIIFLGESSGCIIYPRVTLFDQGGIQSGVAGTVLEASLRVFSSEEPVTRSSLDTESRGNCFIRLDIENSTSNCNPEAETALQPPIWHSEGSSLQGFLLFRGSVFFLSRTPVSTVAASRAGCPRAGGPLPRRPGAAELRGNLRDASALRSREKRSRCNFLPSLRVALSFQRFDVDLQDFKVSFERPELYLNILNSYIDTLKRHLNMKGT